MRSQQERRVERDLSVDLYRVLVIVIVVVGHWLAASVTYRDGRFGDDNVLTGMPWTQWLTLLFHVIPVFFLAAGYGSAASWQTWRASNGRWAGWLRHWSIAVLAPTTAYLVVVLAAILALDLSGVDGVQIGYGAWAVAFHLWFLPVYVVLVAGTPVLLAAGRRWGLGSVGGLAALVAMVDIASLGGWLGELGSVNYPLGWATVYQLGIAWRVGALRGRRPVALAAVGLLGVIMLVWLGAYPLSMVGVPGQTLRNTSPPTLALVAFAAAQSGLLLTVAPAVAVRLRRSRARRRLAVANGAVMGIYLWHMAPVVAAALLLYPTGLFPQAALGSAAWWLARAGWLSVLAALMVVTLIVVARARVPLGHWTPTLRVRLPAGWTAALVLTAAAVAAYTLLRFAIDGFAPGGRVPLGVTAAYLCAVAVLALCTPRGDE